MSLTKHGNEHDAIKFASYLEEYMKAVIEGPDTIKSIVSDVEDSLKSALEMKD